MSQGTFEETKNPDITTLLRIEDYALRKKVIYELGYKNFLSWFQEPDFINFWQLNGYSPNMYEIRKSLKNPNPKNGPIADNWSSDNDR